MFWNKMESNSTKTKFYEALTLKFLYINNWLNHIWIFEFCRKTGQQCALDEVVPKLNNLHLKLSDRFMLLDRLSGLQSFLQILLELVVVGDRMLFLQEAGFEPKAVRLFDDQVRYFLFGNKTLKLSSLVNVSLSKATALDNTFRKQSKKNSTKPYI